MFAHKVNQSDSSEYVNLGNVYLPGIKDRITSLPLENGMELSFGEILALTDDYLSFPQKPICLANSEEEKSKCFMEGYQKFSQTPQKIIKDRLKNGVYKKTTIHLLTKQQPLSEDPCCHFNVETLQLADDNFDHFYHQAEIAYWTGHQEAMRAAVLAASISDPSERERMLAYAYSLEAFACHFLLDRFKSDHIRTPRLYLDQQLGTRLGALFSLFQCQEDGGQGLNVYSMNQVRGIRKDWNICGNEKLFIETDSLNRTFAKELIQVGANEVYVAFLRKKVFSQQECTVLAQLPMVAYHNFSPLFRVNRKGKVEVRQHLSPIQEKDDYVALTDLKCIEILDVFGSRFSDEAITNEIAELKLELSKNHGKRNCFNHLSSFSVFSPSSFSHPLSQHHQTNSIHAYCTIS